MKTSRVIMALLALAGSALAKDRRTFYDDAFMARVRAKIEQHDWAKNQVRGARAAAKWLVDMSDQELWDFVPPPEQLRAINVCNAVGCPFCGEEIIRKRGHYPWLMSSDHPFKVQCPICKRRFPENDFVPWNTAGKDAAPESGDRIVDKGVGWVDKAGHRYYFVAYYIFWHRWKREILGGMRALGKAYLLTGEPIYGHKCGVLLAKLASEYERFDYPTQCYHEGLFGVRGRISDYIWSTGDDSAVALAYDAAYPIFESDPKLAAFLKAKGIDNPRNLIERKMLDVMAGDILRGYVAGNMGAHQDAMCHLAIVLDNDDPARGHTTAEMREWLMRGEGRVEDLMWNGFFRDGLGGESSPGYSSGWCYKFYALAELLPKLGVDIWANPRLRRMAEIGIDMTVAGKFCPCIGDAGGVMGSGPVAWHASLQGPAFTRYHDPKFAKALARIKATSRNLWEDYFDEDAVAEAIAKHGTEIDWRTRNLGGYGLAILESGSGEHRRAATMYYGDATGGHGHRDRLTIGLFGFGLDLFPEMGYPTPFRTLKRAGWTSNTISHYCVVIDDQPQNNMHAGRLNTLAASPSVQLMDTSAENAYTGLASLYRRTTALVDISPDRYYLLDIFRVRGGKQHDWSFHGPAHFTDFSVAGGALGPVQKRGTLAGEDIPYGGKIPQAKNPVRFVIALQTADGVFQNEPYAEVVDKGWGKHCKGVVTKKVGGPLTAKTRAIPAGKVKVFLKAYDYGNGVNEVDIAIGDATRTWRFEPGAKRGWRWVSEVYDLSAPATQVIVTVRARGQSYVTIDELVITTDLHATSARAHELADPNRSGHQYLFNIRRMKPAGMWSATWRKPGQDLAMTMTMPAGCAQEVIAADAIPELQPRNPKTIQYVLGRNALAGRDGELAATYISVTEPHRGPASVSAVERLPAEHASDGAVGLVVRRGALRDLVHSSTSPTEPCTWRVDGKTLEVTGEFALVTLDAQGVQRAVLVNGTSLRYRGFALQPDPSPAGKVLAVDPKANAITIDAALAAPEALRGAVVIISNELHQTSYTITDAKVADGKTTLSFGDVLLRVGMGEVKEIDQAAGVVKSDRKLYGYGHIDGGLHAGRWLFNDDMSKGLRIGSMQGDAFKLDNAGADLAAIFADANGDGRQQYWICDIGPGDAYRIPLVTYCSR